MSTSTEDQPSKRPREQEDTSAIPTTAPNREISVCRSCDFWFPDGNIVIHAGNIHFRVHRGVLSLHSTSFKHAFEVPQPVNEPLIEGCPVMLAVDEAEHWKVFLAYMYRPDLVNPLNANLPPAYLTAMLTLGHKYQCDTILRQFRVTLQQKFPTDSRGYLKLKSDPKQSVYNCHHSDLYRLINLAVTLDVKEILASAFFLAACGDIKNIIHGCPRPEPHHFRVYLCPQAQSAIVIGRDRIRPKTLSIYTRKDGLLDSQSKRYVGLQGQCSTPDECGAKRQTATRMLTQQIMVDLEFAVCPETRLRDAYQNLCQACKRELTSDTYDYQQEFWNALPSLFTA